ncbi:TolC family protein [Chitinophaga cymbidii]|uniref:Transporter n=1 Tax=Chitinophaga cymbidii TaxID=1096750 RepID=A0A512RPW4_9BACT|nr:TolC family protein [Chitinophaga cymbidii]GEP97735.1 hypothetical protein CCY01nite_39950 [Chitinophaga cymbidii]
MLKKVIFTTILFFIFSNLLMAQNDLQFYIRSAKENSPLIKDNKNQKEATRMEVERLKAMYVSPQAGVTANYLLAPVLSQDNGKTALQLNPVNPQKYIGYDVSANNGGLYQGLIGISQPLFGRQKLDVLADQATISRQIYDNTIRLTEHDIEKIVTDQYILCLQNSRQADFVGGYIQLLEEQQQVVTKLVNASILKLSDLSLLNIELQTQVIARKALDAAYRSSLLDLNVLSGISDTTLHTLPDIALTISPEVNGSSFVSKFDLDKSALNAQQRVFELKYKPLVSVFANSGLSAVNTSTLYRRFGVNAGVSLAWTLYDGKQKKISRERTNILLKSSDAYKETFLRQNEVRKNRYAVELQNTAERISLVDEQLMEYDKLLANYKQQLLTGQISVIDYVNTLKNAMALQRELLLLQTNSQLIINNHNYWNW